MKRRLVISGKKNLSVILPVWYTQNERCDLGNRDFDCILLGVGFSLYAGAMLILLMHKNDFIKEDIL